MAKKTVGEKPPARKRAPATQKVKAAPKKKIKEKKGDESSDDSEIEADGPPAKFKYIDIELVSHTPWRLSGRRVIKS